MDTQASSCLDMEFQQWYIAPKIVENGLNKIVSGFSLNKLEIQHLIFMPNLIEILISKQLVGLIVNTMKYLVINGALLKV